MFVEADADMTELMRAVASMPTFAYTDTVDIRGDYTDAEMFEVSRIVEMEDWSFPSQGPTINIIAVQPGKTPVEDAERYDLGLCQIYFDGQKVVASAAYYQDKMEGTLTLCRCTSAKGLERSERRARRLQEKYPAHAFLIPTRFAEFL